PCVARRQQTVPRRPDPRLDRLGGLIEIFRDALERLETMQMPAAFEVRLAIEPEARREGRVLVRGQQTAHLLAIPDVEAAFVSVGVGIEARAESTFGRAHLAQCPI